jgi:hypothetical protein
MKRMFTLQKAAQLVIELQDACNLSGLVHDFPNFIDAVWEEAHRLNKGTDYVNTHPIVVMMVSKLADLSRYSYGDEQDNFNKAYDACKKIAAGENHDNDSTRDPKEKEEASAGPAT